MTAIDVIKNLHKKKLTSKQLKFRSDDKASVKALQNVLYELGFGKELKWNILGLMVITVIVPWRLLIISVTTTK